MAIGDVIPKKLCQVTLSSTLANVYTAPSNIRTQVCEIWVDNQCTSADRFISLYAHGNNLSNRLSHNIPIVKDTGIVISDNHIVLQPGESIAMSQTVGTDVVVTIYGIEEVIS